VGERAFLLWGGEAIIDSTSGVVKVWSSCIKPGTALNDQGPFLALLHGMR